MNIADWHFQLAWSRNVKVRADGDDLTLRANAGRALRLHRPDAAKRHLVVLLLRGGLSTTELCEAALLQDPQTDLAELYYLLTLAANKALLCYVVAYQGRPIAALEPVTNAFRFEPIVATQRYQLSRFAFQRRGGNETVVECPLGHAQVVLKDARAATLMALLCQARTVSELTAELSSLDEPTVAAFVTLLLNARAAFTVDTEGNLPEDISEPLQQWEFHDLLFHTRTRAGRHDMPMGATYRFAKQRSSLPVVKPRMTNRYIILEPPRETLMMPFQVVIQTRRSQATPGPRPLHVAQLSALLHHAARVQSVLGSDPSHELAYPASKRPCASGGATHALEIYLTVTRCDGLGTGFYHYDPLAHGLEHLADLGSAHDSFLRDAHQAMGTDHSPDVLISIAARFQRNSWKYQSIAYALVLKDVGALYQQLYLVATALRLAPCALGGGNADEFAQATGEDYYAETTVGEFAISGA